MWMGTRSSRDCWPGTIRSTDRGPVFWYRTHGAGGRRWRTPAPCVQINGTGSFILAAVLLGLVNAFVRPLAFLFTLPLTILTLGLFLLVLNAAMFGLVAAMLDDFSVAGLGSGILGSLIVSITSTIACWYIGPGWCLQGQCEQGPSEQQHE